MRAYFDADVVIAHLRGRRAAFEAIERSVANGDELWMAAPQRVEIRFHMRPGEEAVTDAILARFQTEPLTERIVDEGGAYYRRWNPGHGIDRFDALLAATVKLTGGRIVTQNVRHFPMPDINVEQGWDPASNQ